MEVIKGNILDIKEGIICHQVNCKGVAGAGLAKQIWLKYVAGYAGNEQAMGWYNDYRMKWHSDQHDILKGARLGTVGWYYVSNKPELIIANLYAQFDYGIDKQHTDYHALRTCLSIVAFNCGNRKVYFPYGVGSGNGGGSWAVISGIIEDVLPSAIIVKLGD